MERRKMDSYWPGAITEDGQKLFTYEAAQSISECIDQFNIWREHYHYDFDEAYIDHNGKRTYYRLQWIADRRMPIPV